MSKIDRAKEKARRARRLEKQQQVSAELAQREDEVAEEEMPIEQEPATAESEADLHKEYGEMGMMMLEPAMAPTTFHELDMQREAEEKAEKVREVTWDVRMLVDNILYHPELTPREKARRIQDAALGFDQRVEVALKHEEMEKSVEALQAEALLASYDRNTSILQKTADKTVEVSKMVLDTATRKKLSDDDFALVYKDGEKVIRKYPIHDKAHVRNALARAAQQDDEDARKAMPKIRAAAKRFGIEMEKSAILIEKDAKGDWRWVGRPTNNFIDYQTDIISKSAHEKYVGWLDANPELAPVFCTWHIPGTARQNPVDFWMEKDGAVIMSGILTEAEAGALFKMQKEVDLGMSFQGMGLRLDSSDPRVITDYWMYEVSDLPLDKAANPFTRLETMIKEVGMDKLQYLAGIMGSEEKAKSYLEKTGQMQKQLQEAGITSKEKAEEVKEEPKTPEPATPPSVIVDVNGLIAKMKDEFDFEGLNAFVAQAQEDHGKVETLESLVKELLQSKEDALAEALTPPVGRYAWSRENRPSQADRTKLSKDKGKDEEDDKLLKSAPGVPDGYWLSELTNTAPVTSE